MCVCVFSSPPCFSAAGSHLLSVPLCAEPESSLLVSLYCLAVCPCACVSWSVRVLDLENRGVVVFRHSATQASALLRSGTHPFLLRLHLFALSPCYSALPSSSEYARLSVHADTHTPPSPPHPLAIAAGFVLTLLFHRKGGLSWVSPRTCPSSPHPPSTYSPIPFLCSLPFWPLPLVLLYTAFFSSLRRSLPMSSLIALRL